MLDYEEIRKEIAIAHNVLLDKDDSALVMATLNDLMFRHYSKHLAQQVAEQNATQRKAIEEAQQKGIEDAKEIGSRVINLATEHVSKYAREAITAAVDSGVERMKAIEIEREEPTPDIKLLWWGALLGSSPFVLYHALVILNALSV
jgi:GTPase involved in cell partitioning and DNA repair